MCVVVLDHGAEVFLPQEDGSLLTVTQELGADPKRHGLRRISPVLDVRIPPCPHGG